MARLTEAMQLAIVRALARGASDTDARTAVEREFGPEHAPQSVAGYDPMRAAGRRLSRKLKAVFYVTRWAHANEMAPEPDEELAARLRVLLEELEQVPALGRLDLVADLLHQAAKACGVLGAEPDEADSPGTAAPGMCDRGDTKWRA